MQNYLLLHLLEILFFQANILIHYVDALIGWNQEFPKGDISMNVHLMFMEGSKFNLPYLLILALVFTI